MEPSSPRRLMIVAGLVGIAIVLGLVVVQRSRSAEGQGAAFHVSEAGANYILHVLNSGACTPEELLAQQPIVQPVPGATSDEPLGTFAVTIAEESDTAGRLMLTAEGREGGLMGACHRLAATVEPFSGILGTKYRVASWDRQGAVGCGNLARPAPLSCEGWKPQQ